MLDIKKAINEKTILDLVAEETKAAQEDSPLHEWPFPPPFVSLTLHPPKEHRACGNAQYSLKCSYQNYLIDCTYL